MRVKEKIWILTGLFQTSYVLDIRVGLEDNTFGFLITPPSFFVSYFFSIFHLGSLHLIPQSLVLSECGKKIGTLRHTVLEPLTDHSRISQCYFF